MIVSELIQQLEKLDPSMLVLLQSDPEGNGYFWADGAEAGVWVEDETLKSDRAESAYSEQDMVERAEYGGEDPESRDGYTQVVVVYP